jgi:hypothetical protein
MIFGFKIWTPLSIQDASALVASINAVVDRVSHERPDDIGSAGTISAEDDIPDIDAIKKIHPNLKRPLVALLESCESAIVINDPGNIEGEPILVSILRHILKNSGGCAIDWGGLTIGGEEIETAEQALENLTAFEDHDELFKSMMEPPEAFESDPATPENPAEALRDRVIELLTRAQEDLDFGADVRKAIDRSSPAAKNLMRLMVSGGSQSDAEIARGLQVPLERLGGIRSEVESLLERFS